VVAKDWWVRVLADSTHSIFKEAKDRLTEETISDITTIGTMVKDFDAEDPDTDTLNTVFSAFSASRWHPECPAWGYEYGILTAL
jgi:hypothetical protein